VLFVLDCLTLLWFVSYPFVMQMYKQLAKKARKTCEKIYFFAKKVRLR
jgi:hypothetical protein